MSQRSVFGKAVCGLAILSLGGGWWLARGQVGSTPAGIQQPDRSRILEEGNIPDAMARSRRLLDAYRAADWDVLKVSPNLLYLPDQQHSENPQIRKLGAQVSAFVFPRRTATTHQEIAFYTTLYARANITRLSNEVSRAKPDGFYIVAWKDGRIEQVAVEDVRLLPLKPGVEVQEVFPGMDVYDENLRKLPYVEASEGKNAAKP